MIRRILIQKGTTGQSCCRTKTGNMWLRSTSILKERNDPQIFLTPGTSGSWCSYGVVTPFSGSPSFPHLVFNSESPEWFNELLDCGSSMLLDSSVNQIADCVHSMQSVDRWFPLQNATICYLLDTRFIGRRDLVCSEIELILSYSFCFIRELGFRTFFTTLLAL